MTERTRPCACGGEITKKPGPGRWPHRCEECRQPKLAGSIEVRCGECGSPFSKPHALAARSHRPPKFCSDECKRLAALRRSREWIAANPEKYKAQIEAKSAHQRRATVDRAAARSCPYCEGPMTPRRRKHCGAPKCRHQYNNQRLREFMRKRKAETGASYVAQFRGLGHNAKLAALPKDPVRMAARKQEGWQRRRAQKLATTVEKFRHEDVYERDGWICQLCIEPVDRELRYPDPMSASLDHVIPLSRGGHHTRDNVQLAHLICNTEKQARIAEE